MLKKHRWAFFMNGTIRWRSSVGEERRIHIRRLADDGIIVF
jgi:hypothetical protein